MKTINGPRVISDWYRSSSVFNWNIVEKTPFPPLHKSKNLFQGLTSRILGVYRLHGHTIREYSWAINILKITQTFQFTTKLTVWASDCIFCVKTVRKVSTVFSSLATWEEVWKEMTKSLNWVSFDLFKIFSPFNSEITLTLPWLPRSDQHLISPRDFNALSHKEVMRIRKLISWRVLSKYNTNSPLRRENN